MKHRLFFGGIEITNYILGYKVDLSEDEDELVYYIDLPKGFLKWSGGVDSFYDEKTGDVSLHLGGRE